MNPIIELKDYLPQQPSLDLTPYERRNAARFRQKRVLAAIEAAVTAAIGVCMVICTAAMVAIL